KGNTLLNFGNIALDYIIDENPLKQKLYTPGMNILIEPPERLIQEKRPALVIPLAWNFFEEIYKKTKGFRPRTDDRFLLYFPSLSIRE
ncbi:MAG: SAM-dependent methyltransferase, partial [Patescibacteria group bacterium]